MFYPLTGTISAANSCPASPRQGFHQNQNNYNNYSNNNLQNVSLFLNLKRKYLNIIKILSNFSNKIYSKRPQRPVIIIMKNHLTVMLN